MMLISFSKYENPRSLPNVYCDPTHMEQDSFQSKVLVPDPLNQISDNPYCMNNFHITIIQITTLIKLYIKSAKISLSFV
jgi:hypothetical protein